MYHFARLDNYPDLRQPLLNLMKTNNIRGTLLLAREGINGTVAGTRKGIDNLLNFLRSDARLENIVTKESFSEDMPFDRAKVKLKKEIVTMGVEDIDPTHIVGTYVKPAQWNTLISDPETVVVDTRNDYEVGIGTFKHAVNPNTRTFREFPAYVQEHLSDAKKKKVAMFCTGGIRCEKSTAYLKSQGFEEVYHLEGGILKYLEEIPAEESLWEGECFVFDKRVAVTHGLAQGQYDQCHACRRPITEKDKQHPHYALGISCHQCYDEKDEEQRRRYAERQKQVELADDLGIPHMGGDIAQLAQQRRVHKQLLKELQ